MSDFVICLKNELFAIPKTKKPQVQTEISNITKKIEEYKALIKDLEIQKRKKQVELLSERQQIYYKNPINRNLPSEQLEKTKAYEKRKKLLKEYDDSHGSYIKPEQGY